MFAAFLTTKKGDCHSPSKKLVNTTLMTSDIWVGRRKPPGGFLPDSIGHWHSPSALQGRGATTCTCTRYVTRNQHNAKGASPQSACVVEECSKTFHPAFHLSPMPQQKRFVI